MHIFLFSAADLLDFCIYVNYCYGPLQLMHILIIKSILKCYKKRKIYKCMFKCFKACIPNEGYIVYTHYIRPTIFTCSGSVSSSARRTDTRLCRSPQWHEISGSHRWSAGRSFYGSFHGSWRLRCWCTPCCSPPAEQRQSMAIENKIWAHSRHESFSSQEGF